MLARHVRSLQQPYRSHVIIKQHPFLIVQHADVVCGGTRSAERHEHSRLNCRIGCDQNLASYINPKEQKAMQIYLDTANINEIREAASWGILSGVTTNPSLIAREKG